MKKSKLLEVAIVTSPEAEDAITELLGNIFGQSPATYTNEETQVTRVSVYCAKRADWNPARRKVVGAGLRTMRGAGLDIGAGVIKARSVAPEDWAESWKRHFKPIEIGDRLLIKPSWIKRRPKKNQAVVVLDPGLSFGTGNHPTTSFCLRELAARRNPGQAQSFWDVGTGSGILAIAAVKLGYAPVRAIDFDLEAVRVAKQNARQNRVEKKIQLCREDITKPRSRREKYDVICANLISNLLIAEKARLARRLAPGGALVVAGILAKEFHEVQSAFEEIGLKLADSFEDGEWCSGAFVSSE
jgi:ribosomal protein L11 methyltransferase